MSKRGITIAFVALGLGLASLLAASVRLAVLTGRGALLGLSIMFLFFIGAIAGGVVLAKRRQRGAVGIITQYQFLRRQYPGEEVVPLWFLESDAPLEPFAVYDYAFPEQLTLVTDPIGLLFYAEWGEILASIPWSDVAGFEMGRRVSGYTGAPVIEISFVDDGESLIGFPGAVRDGKVAFLDRPQLDVVVDRLRNELATHSSAAG